MKTKITLFLLINIIFFYQAYAQCTGVDFEERNGIAILEMESKLAGSWQKESVTGASAGSALTYRGGNAFHTPGGSLITYAIKINSPGSYRFIWRSKISIIASQNPSSEHNDSWLKINGSDFYGKKGSHRVYPGGSGKSPVANGSTSGGYLKVYTNTVNWSWVTRTSDGDYHEIYADFNQAGIYTIQVSGRSSGHTIDRMVLYKESSYSASSAQNLSTAQTNCSGGSTPPTTPTPPTPPANNVPPTVSFSNITNGQNFAIGSSVTVGLSANDSDGSISKYQIFVNNTLVDTDGASYSPYLLSQLTAGSYAVKATVTDNSGASTSATVNFTVGGSTTPPPVPTTPTGNNPPTVNFTNFSNGQNFSVGGTLAIGLNANDTDGSISKHEIFVNNVLVDTDGTSYTPHPLALTSSGSYSIKATVTDNSGTSTSTTANITVGSGSPTPPTPPTGGSNNPIVNFSNLSNGQQVAIGSTVSVGVNASDTDGSIVKYQIYVDGILVDTDGSNYTPHPIVGISAGNHEIKVIVTDNSGATASSTIVIVAGSGTPTTPTNPTPTPSAISFNLINASSNASIGPLSNGTSLSSNDAQGVNVRANAPTNTQSVVFTLSGALSRSWTESAAPYALFGDTNGDYVSANLPNGSYSLKAVAYSGSNGSGSIIANTTINFSIAASSGLTAKTIAYPNPVKSDGRISLKLPTGTSGEYTYYVTNAIGIQLEQGEFTTSQSQTDVDLQLSNLGRQIPGVYYLTLVSSVSKQTIPIVRE